MNKRTTKRKSATENYILKFLIMGNFSKTTMYCYVHDYKYAPNLESLLTQQYVCVMCTL
jgi:hypothetical protein